MSIPGRLLILVLGASLAVAFVTGIISLVRYDRARASYFSAVAADRNHVYLDVNAGPTYTGHDMWDLSARCAYTSADPSTWEGCELMWVKP